MGAVAGQIAGSVIGGVMANKAAKKQASAQDAAMKMQMQGYTDARPYIQDMYSGGTDALNNALATGTYQGPNYAGDFENYANYEAWQYVMLQVK